MQGDSSPFTIDINKDDETVDDLKVKIFQKKKKRLNGIDAKDIALYRFDASVNDSWSEEKTREAVEKKMHPNALSSIAKLSKLYSFGVPEDCIHIIAKIPPGRHLINGHLVVAH